MWWSDKLIRFNRLSVLHFHWRFPMQSIRRISILREQYEVHFTIRGTKGFINRTWKRKRSHGKLKVSIKGTENTEGRRTGQKIRWKLQREDVKEGKCQELKDKKAKKAETGSSDLSELTSRILMTEEVLEAMLPWVIMAPLGFPTSKNRNTSKPDIHKHHG